MITKLGEVLLNYDRDFVIQVQSLDVFKFYKVLSVDAIDEVNQYGKPLKWVVNYESLYK